MYILIFIILIVNAIFLYLIFNQVEHCIDNQNDISDYIIRIDKNLWKLQRKVKK